MYHLQRGEPITPPRSSGTIFAHEKVEFLKQNIFWDLRPVPDQRDVFARCCIIDPPPSILSFLKRTANEQVALFHSIEDAVGIALRHLREKRPIEVCVDVDVVLAQPPFKVGPGCCDMRKAA